MNKLELITILRGLIKEELRDSKFLHSIVKNVIKEEVRREVDKLLTEMEEKQPSDASLVEMASHIPVGSKQKLDGLRSRMETHESEPQKEESVVFVKNRKLNALLNETLMDVRTGRATLPQDPEAQANEWQTMQYNKDPRSFAGARALNVPPGAQKPVEAMLPSVDVEGRPLAIDPNELPDHLKNALTKNYKPLMKKIKEKQGR